MIYKKVRTCHMVNEFIEESQGDCQRSTFVVELQVIRCVQCWMTISKPVRNNANFFQNSDPKFEKVVLNTAKIFLGGA